MGSRLELQTFLEELLGSDAVYFQPPETVSLVYPCLIYKRSDIHSLYASNKVYGTKQEYTITVIYKDPDSDIPNKVAHIDTAAFEREFTVDNLYHEIFTIFY